MINVMKNVFIVGDTQIPINSPRLTYFRSMMYLIAEIWDSNIFPLPTSTANITTLLTNEDGGYLNVSWCVPIKQKYLDAVIGNSNMPRIWRCCYDQYIDAEGEMSYMYLNTVSIHVCRSSTLLLDNC